MSDEPLPVPQSSGSLEPPGTPPPTALAAATPLPEPLSGPVRWLPAHRRTAVGKLIDCALDALDEIGDRVRSALTGA